MSPTNQILLIFPHPFWRTSFGYIRFVNCRKRHSWSDVGISAEILLMHELDSKPEEALPLLKKLFCTKESLTPVS